MKYFILFFVINIFANLALTNEIAITFDDLLTQGTDVVDEQIEINNMILEVLKKHRAVAVDKETEKKIKILKS